MKTLERVTWALIAGMSLTWIPMLAGDGLAFVIFTGCAMGVVALGTVSILAAVIG